MRVLARVDDLGSSVRIRGPPRRRTEQREEFLRRVPGAEPVADVLAVLVLERAEPGQVDGVHREPRGRERRGHLPPVLGAGPVVVAEEVDPLNSGPHELLGVALAPLPGAAVVRRGRETEPHQRGGVLFALDAGAEALALELGQVVEEGLDAVQVVDPPAPPIGPTLIEALRLEAHGLVADHARQVAVVVGGDDDGPATSLMRVVEEVGHCETVAGHDVLGPAGRMTAEQDAVAFIVPLHRRVRIRAMDRARGLPPAPIADGVRNALGGRRRSFAGPELLFRLIERNDPESPGARIGRRELEAEAGRRVMPAAGGDGHGQGVAVAERGDGAQRVDPERIGSATKISCPFHVDVPQ
jgi:hypothetical protein